MLFEYNLKSLKKVYQGTVRDIYEVDDKHWLIVASDRLSAFDVILPDPIPKKGIVLTTVSNFWFDRFSNKVKNHLSDIRLEDIIQDNDERLLLKDRSVIVRKLKALPFEAIVRGYVIGSGWKEYQNTGAICGVSLPENLKQAQQLEQPIFTPSTKAAVGDHDENVHFEAIVNIVGKDIAKSVRDISISIYKEAAEYALQRGIIIADTKFEFGLDENGEIVLIDEALTPDSSRFWPLDSYQAGTSPKSYDKQYVRDYLETLDWNKQAPGPKLPQEIIDNTSAKYLEACERLTGISYIKGSNNFHKY
ncbi:MAG: phosphoribosylaminoimidazolesuccinocarboxamide synthase [Gammaproteobacteria bacterium]